MFMRLVQYCMFAIVVGYIDAFQYSTFRIPISLLADAMRSVDKTTKLTRGRLLILTAVVWKKLFEAL